MKISVVLILAVFVFCISSAEAQLSLTVHTDQTTKTVSTGIYGQFLEHIFNSVHGGLWGDQILNGTLEVSGGMRGRGTRRGPTAADASAADMTAAASAGRAAAPAAPVAAPTTNPPRYWEIVDDANAVTIDRDNPFNADVSVRIVTLNSDESGVGPGIRQQNIALKQDEKYTLSLYARGNGRVFVSFQDEVGTLFSKSFTELTSQWQKYTIEFTSPRTANSAALTIRGEPGPVNVDQVSLFSAPALATGGYRPDLMKAVQDLRPASIRWPGGAFVGRYVWQSGVGPHEKRIPYPGEIWNDRDNNQFGTDEFIQFCEKVGAEPIIVINTNRGVEDALNWLEYCMGDATTEYGKQRAANGHPAPYVLKTIEIDNELWRSTYIGIAKEFCPAIRAKYPNLKLSVVGSYGYDTGGRGQQGNIPNWDASLVEQAGKLFDIISPHYYNGIYVDADYVEDPYKYEQFLKSRGEIIKKSENPNIKVYVSEWNLTENRRGNDWRMGLYAGGILNAFERQCDIVTMACPALFLRKQGVTKDWDNALINFDQSRWFPAANYVVMKLWRDSFAPNLLAVDGPDHPLNFVATRSADKKIVYLKAVNPTATAIEAAIRLDGDMTPKTATMQLVNPGSDAARNTLEQPDNIKVVPAAASVENRTVKFTMPPLSAGVVTVTQ